MHTLNNSKDLFVEIAKACDTCLKPWRHSVIDCSPKEKKTLDELNIDLILRIECRCKDGKRFSNYDLEMEIYQSGDDISITLSLLSFPDSPMLWHGKHSIWMDSLTGKKTKQPERGADLEALARRIRSLLLLDE